MKTWMDRGRIMQQRKEHPPIEMVPQSIPDFRQSIAERGLAKEHHAIYVKSATGYPEDIAEIAINFRVKQAFISYGDEKNFQEIKFELDDDKESKEFHQKVARYLTERYGANNAEVSDFCCFIKDVLNIISSGHEVEHDGRSEEKGKEVAILQEAERGESSKEKGKGIAITEAGYEEEGIAITQEAGRERVEVVGEDFGTGGITGPDVGVPLGSTNIEGRPEVGDHGTNLAPAPLGGLGPPPAPGKQSTFRRVLEKGKEFVGKGSARVGRGAKRVVTRASRIFKSD
ncbi:hypothetical protein AA313_de0202776 [Arthrobotrys entomopaga]|nr:hypothetical protein AA313_de0202776 [Arthrobotrys entomopaga]